MDRLKRIGEHVVCRADARKPAARTERCYETGAAKADDSAAGTPTAVRPPQDVCPASFGSLPVP